jgi:hypothetical protein
MTTAERLTRLTRATGRPNRRPTTGDGPLCPMDPNHGPTYLSRNRLTFRCPHQSHDLVSRASWPNEPEA